MYLNQSLLVAVLTANQLNPQAQSRLGSKDTEGREECASVCEVCIIWNCSGFQVAISTVCGGACLFVTVNLKTSVRILVLSLGGSDNDFIYHFLSVSKPTSDLPPVARSRVNTGVK